MRHRIVSFVVVPAFAIALSLAGCKSDTGSTSGPAPTASGNSGKKLKIAVSIPAADHGWTAGIKWWADQAAKMYPDVDWNIQTAENPEKQIKDLETMMTSAPDCIVVLATASAPITPIAKQIHERGIFLVNVDRGFLEPVADLFIEGDNKEFGRKSAEYMVERLGGKSAQGNILILRGIQTTVDTDRYDAAMEIFNQHPGIKVVGTERGEWSKQKAYEKAQTLLLANPKVDAIWAQDDDMALGVEQALKEAGRNKNVWILGGAGMKDIVKRVMEKDPLYPADITYPPSMIAVGMFDAVSILRGDKGKIGQFMPRHMKLDVDLITPDNAKTFYFPDSIY